ncbi:phosphodiester glycosidase family protein [Planktothrix sp. FACHB-1365]|uniref:phosphodiester glycosidase family protein n=1 Tax=Planktothrix sp. FACHB-1365 TaxID=2692855 RepID=UPI0016884785|nr:phosphodiester glycosidase family protein [Planktothrix sp. FACHB-1365]MBD2485296.1 phosphodiester glycosidase family protein [Planktothrix sp. FACHB-1365]
MLNFNLNQPQKNLILLLSIIGFSAFPINTIAVPKTNDASQSGNIIELNNHLINIPWRIESTNRNSMNSVQISDIGLMQNMGIHLLDTNNSFQQPIQWFSDSVILSTQYIRPYRYLDLSNLPQTSQWKIQLDGTALKITTPPSTIQSISFEPLSLETESSPKLSNFIPQKIIIELDKPTFWQQPIPDIQKRSPSPSPQPSPPTLTDDPTIQNQPKPAQTAPPTLQDWSLILEAKANPQLLYNNTSNIKLQSQNSQTRLQFSVPPGWRPVVTSLDSPYRLIIEPKPDFLQSKNILWQPGIRWRQEYIEIPKTESSLGSLLNRIFKTPESSVERFPVYWLEVDLNQPNTSLIPILSNTNSRQGTSPLLAIAQKADVLAAINGGFFNRNNQYPLGAIRFNNNWLSSPILNRGAMAWGQDKPIIMNRLILRETITTDSGQTLPLQYLNSGYVEAGISRYTSDWGNSYTPINNQEKIIVVENNQITRHIDSPKSGSPAIPIPVQGYLLVVRSRPDLLNLLPIGTNLQLQSQTDPSDFQHYPNILGAGPLLIQNRQIVLDAALERFNPAFQQQKAIRSAIAITANNTLLILAVHNRPTGSGPSLSELAQILQKLEAVTALNLDGGSSTSLYLGGYYLDRPFPTAAPVHNGLGIVINHQ